MSRLVGPGSVASRPLIGQVPSAPARMSHPSLFAFHLGPSISTAQEVFTSRS